MTTHATPYRRRRFVDAPLTFVQAWVDRFPFLGGPAVPLPEWRREIMLANRAMLDEADEYLLITEDAALAYDLGARRIDPWPLWLNFCEHLGLDVRWHGRNNAPLGACMDLCRVYLALHKSRMVWLDTDARLRARPRFDMREGRPHLFDRGPLAAFYSGIQSPAMSAFWQSCLQALAVGVEQGTWLSVALNLGALHPDEPLPEFPGEYVVHHFRGSGVRRWRARATSRREGAYQCRT
ncbi:hypothetical protein [Oceanidesulfovibrio marinus]|uniref:Uncharacterized protein n=1 Tax=Oceanidesulfovibrio marinus TaxID=370038 RepID=A0A6P1ZKM0_9BACT|nr:hypothetical protein [Oceanidesulfovibrio marinus]TVM34613.1 hypothetical protein DQK91_08560 [Oceanidesulfovibrio marinus]